MNTPEWILSYNHPPGLLPGPAIMTTEGGRNRRLPTGAIPAA
jgi:hypothetical protein